MRKVLFATALCLIGAACSRGPQLPPFKPVADTKTLMEEIMEAQADIVWSSVGTIETAEGTQEIRPTTDEDWRRIRNAAMVVTESGNLLMMVPRAQDGDRWMRAASRLIDEGQKVLAAVERKSPQEVFDRGADLYEACVNCHKHYIPSIKDLYANEP